MISNSRIDKYVNEIFDNIEFAKEPSGLYDPLRYMIRIGGKRLRPSLCLTTYSLYKDVFDETIFSPAAALEVFHSFTLMHDDIMDHSPLRRGEDTVWKKWNESTAILSGDVMLIDAFKRISKAPEEVHGEVQKLFSRTAIEVCEGQQHDMDFEQRNDVTMAEYEKMIGLKTAVLIACSASMGAIIGGAPESDCEALYRYGYELGMAFQVADDYLDAFGDEKVFGKPIGGDILNCKKSWLTIRTLEKTADKASFLADFEESASAPEVKIAKIKQYYSACGVDVDAKNEISRYTGRAVKALDSTSLDSEAKELLRIFAEKLVARAK